MEIIDVVEFVFVDIVFVCYVGIKREEVVWFC